MKKKITQHIMKQKAQNKDGKHPQKNKIIFLLKPDKLYRRLH